MNDTTEFDKETLAPTKKERTTSQGTSRKASEHNDAKEMVALEKQQRNLLEVYKNEPKQAVRVAPSYAKHFGKMMRVSINGISVTVPCDGQSIKLPETFATEVARRMAAIDAYENRQQKMANIKNNFESSPGQLTF